MAKSLATLWHLSLMMPTTGGMKPFQTQRQGVMFTRNPTLFPLMKISRSESFRSKSRPLIWRAMDLTASPRSSTTQEMVRTFSVWTSFWVYLLCLAPLIYLSDLNSAHRTSNGCLCQAGVIYWSSGLVVASGRHWNRPAAVHWGISGTIQLVTPLEITGS